MQEIKLRELLQYLNAHSPWYKKIFKRHAVDLHQIRTLEDLSLLPVTIKEDLQSHNDEFLCVPRNRVIEYTSTSGTLGAPVTVALTEEDLQRLAQCLPSEPELADAESLTLVPTIHFTRMDGHWWRLFLNEDRVTSRLTGREVWLRDDSGESDTDEDETVPSTALCIGIAGEE